MFGGEVRLKAGWCVWITGLPGSGKSVISRTLVKVLADMNIHAQLLSSDALRKILTPKPSYSVEERDIVYETLTYIAVLLTQNGVNVVIDATGNLRRYRDKARQQIPQFIEVFADCPMDLCMKREAHRRETYNAPRQIYSRALEGKASTVPGMGQPYEPPMYPEVTVNTLKYSSEHAARRILDALLKLPQE
jgi:adenylylsulfate kinase